MSGNGMRERDIGLYLDDRGQPAGIKLFSTASIDERLATDSLGQFHLTRWRKFTDEGWKVDFSFVLSAQATRGLITFINSFSTPEGTAAREAVAAVHLTTEESLRTPSPIKDPGKKEEK